MTTPTIQELLPPPCCCRNVPTCDDCPPRTGDICMRIRHEDWPEDMPSLWLIVPVSDGKDHRCGTYNIRDQYGKPADSFGPWSFDYHADAGDYTAVCVADGTGDGSHWEAAPGMVFSAHWSVRYVSCSLVRFGLWESELAEDGTSDFFNPDDVDYIGPPDYEAYVGADWHTTSFNVGPWQLSPAETCEVDAIGPCCLRVTATGLDTHCRFARSEQLPVHDGPMPPPTLDCDTITLGNAFGETGSPCGGRFAGSLSNFDSTAVVWWEINADKTEITIHVGTDSATFAYTPDWWTTGRTVGPYLVGVCVESCDVESSCWPDLCPCLIDGLDGTLYRTIYADVSGDHTETELSLIPGGGIGGDRYQWTRGGSDAITILCMNGGADPYMVSVSLGPDSYFCTIPANGLQCDGGQLVDETITCGDITIRLYTL